MTWPSLAFLVGAFSHSSGIEWAVEAGDIGDAASLRDRLAAMPADGKRFGDGVVLAHSPPRRVVARRGAFGDIAELAAAFVPSRERQLETAAQGRAFIDIARAAWNCDGLDASIASCEGATSIPSRSASSARRMRFRFRPRCTASFTRWPRTGFRRARGWFRSGKLTASACWLGWSRWSLPPRDGRSRHRSTISAAPLSAPTSPACGTRRNIPGCSGRDEARMGFNGIASAMRSIVRCDPGEGLCSIDRPYPSPQPSPDGRGADFRCRDIY